MAGRCIQGINLLTLVGQTAGDPAALFPKCRLLVTQKYNSSYALLGLQLSSSLTIFGANRAGIIMVIGQDQKYLTVSNSINSPISHITGPNSISSPAVVAIPTSKCTSLSFGAYGIPVRAMTPLSLYAFGDATSGNDLFAICALQVAPIVG